VAFGVAQGNTHNNASSKKIVPLMLQSWRNPFAVPLPPTSPSRRVSGAKNGSEKKWFILGSKLVLCFRVLWQEDENFKLLKCIIE
jgi:hypothetical protein